MNTQLCFKLLVEWQIAYGQTSIFLPFRVIIDLKLSGREKDQRRILVSIEDLASDQQCASWSLIPSWYESDNGMRPNQIPNQKKQPLYLLFVELLLHLTIYLRNGCSTWLESAFLKVKTVRNLGKILPKNISYLPGGSSNILSNTPGRPWIPAPVQFVYWLRYACFHK